jgi:hypothetical protein
MEILTAGQRGVISRVARSPLRPEFFLTGGTALSAFYLQHRYSDDLDFPRVPPVMAEVAVDLGASVEFRRLTGSFLECFLTLPGGELVEMDFALDAPFRFEPRRLVAELGIEVDNLLDIAANKLSALYDRSEPKASWTSTPSTARSRPAPSSWRRRGRSTWAWTPTGSRRPAPGCATCASCRG